MASSTVSYSDFVDRVSLTADVTSATIDGEKIVFRGADGRDYVTIQPEGAETTELLVQNDITFSAKPQEQSGFVTVLMTFLPFLLLIGVWIYFMNRMQGGGRGGAMGFGKSAGQAFDRKARADHL